MTDDDKKDDYSTGQKIGIGIVICLCVLACLGMIYVTVFMKNDGSTRGLREGARYGYQGVRRRCGR